VPAVDQISMGYAVPGAGMDSLDRLAHRFGVTRRLQSRATLA
jgi:hypothetical protein